MLAKSFRTTNRPPTAEIYGISDNWPIAAAIYGNASLPILDAHKKSATKPIKCKSAQRLSSEIANKYDEEDEDDMWWPHEIPVQDTLLDTAYADYEHFRQALNAEIGRQGSAPKCRRRRS